MGDPNKPNRRSTVLITLLASGVFLIGAGLFPLLINAQQKALESVDPVIAPTVTHFSEPQFALSDPEGSPVSMEKYARQVILINNWAPWCPPCVSEMSELQAYYTAHLAEGFAVIAIDAGDPAANVAAFVKQHGLTFPVWLDPLSKSLGFFKNWDLPSSYLIDRDGIVRYAWMGGINRATLEKYVTPLMEATK
jgi:peroxiredoxin